MSIGTGVGESTGQLSLAAWAATANTRTWGARPETPSVAVTEEQATPPRTLLPRGFQ